ncbi:hypothetical protein [Sulfurovum sp.]|uniref:hypothetical protein n=1 Tax=Sulfurovum sp. TaxID=1969726 RepID=UPI0028680139|nr:hypothetical protein [Sulfurovum sp.]
MIDFQAVMQRLKHVLSLHQKKEKILDKDIADALKLDPRYFAVIKKRKKIPYEAIAYFCEQYHISMNWILLEQNTPNLT